MSDSVNHPAHYTEHPSGVECIQITEHMGFNLGNAMKYIWRADLKGSAIEDLEKARWYIDRELAKRVALFPATEPAEPAASEGVNCGANSVVLGWCTLSAQHEGLHTNGTYFWGQAPAPAEPAEEETKAEPSTRQIADVIVEGRSQNMSWMQIAEMVKQVFFPTETGPWQDWPSLDAIPADVRTVWDKAGDEYRRTNGGWKFRSHGGKWQQITLPLDDYIDFAPFTTAAVAVWDPELGTRNDWTLNEGTDK